MFKIILKHNILETCINALFDSCISSFSAPSPNHCMRYSGIQVGDHYDKLVFKIDIPGNDLIVREFKNCHIKDIYRVVSPLDLPILVFDSDVMRTSVYNRDGRVIGYSVDYENHNIHLSTKWLTDKVEIS